MTREPGYLRGGVGALGPIDTPEAFAAPPSRTEKEDDSFVLDQLVLALGNQH